MCLLACENDHQSRTRVRRGLAAMGIVLIVLYLAIGFLHPPSSTEADFLDFLRGLTLGVGLVFSVTAFMLCVRRPRPIG